MPPSPFLAGESAQASESLSELAVDLKGLVARFKV